MVRPGIDLPLSYYRSSKSVWQNVGNECLINEAFVLNGAQYKLGVNIWLTCLIE